MTKRAFDKIAAGLNDAIAYAKTDTRIHPDTGKVLRRDVRQQTVAVGSLSRVVDVPGWYPDDNSDSLHSGADLKVSNEAFQGLRASGPR